MLEVFLTLTNRIEPNIIGVQESQVVSKREVGCPPAHPRAFGPIHRQINIATYQEGYGVANQRPSSVKFIASCGLTAVLSESRER